MLQKISLATAILFGAASGQVAITAANAPAVAAAKAAAAALKMNVTAIAAEEKMLEQRMKNAMMQAKPKQSQVGAIAKSLKHLSKRGMKLKVDGEKVQRAMRKFDRFGNKAERVWGKAFERVAKRFEETAAQMRVRQAGALSSLLRPATNALKVVTDNALPLERTCKTAAFYQCCMKKNNGSFTVGLDPELSSLMQACARDSGCSYRNLNAASADKVSQSAALIQKRGKALDDAIQADFKSAARASSQTLETAAKYWAQGFAKIVQEEFGCRPQCMVQVMQRSSIRHFRGNDLVRKCGCKPPVRPAFEGEALLTDADMMELTNYEFRDFQLDSAEDLLEINNEPSDELLNEVKAEEKYEMEQEEIAQAAEEEAEQNASEDEVEQAQLEEDAPEDASDNQAEWIEEDDTTELGEAAPAEAPAKTAGKKAVTPEAKPKAGSNTLVIIIVVVVLVLLAGGAVWFFFIRKSDEAKEVEGGANAEDLYRRVVDTNNVYGR